MQTPNAGACSVGSPAGGYLTYMFGVGAESRNTPTTYGAPYGLVFKNTQEWGANIHLLRTHDVVSVKNCIECGYGPNKTCSHPSEAGRFACCMTGSICSLKHELPNVSKNYYLQYTVTWTENLQDVVPVKIMVLDASNCNIEYNIAAGSARNPIDVTELSWTSPYAGDIVFGIGHQHIGSENITLSLDGTPLCTSVPRYGTEAGVAGNELGYVVEIPACDFSKSPVKVKKGSKITLTSLYNVDPADTRGLPNVPGGEHGGVMSLWYLAVVFDVNLVNDGDATLIPVA